MGYALYDADSNLYEKGKILLSSLAENRHEQLTHGIKVEKGGYIETFLVNETAEDVFFDNFRIQSQASNTVQVMHYYPFGMEMPAQVYNNPAMVKNRYLYNQGTGDVTYDTERLPDLNVDLTKFRVYDPALGRWWQVDPMADAMSSWTPYNYGFNSPIRFNDPLGDEPSSRTYGQSQDAQQAKKEDPGSWLSENYFKNDSFDGVLELLKRWLWWMISPPSDPEEAEQKVKAHAVTGKIKKGLEEVKEGQDAVIEVFPAGFVVTAMNDGAHGDFSGEEFAQNAGFEAAFALLPGLVKEPIKRVSGRLGNTATRNQIAAIAIELERRGYEIINGGGMRNGVRLPEEYLPPLGGGRSGGSYVDITAVHPDYGTLRINTVDVNRNGSPTLRELKNAARIRTQMAPGEHLLLIPKR